MPERSRPPVRYAKAQTAHSARRAQGHAAAAQRAGTARRFKAGPPRAKRPETAAEARGTSAAVDRLAQHEHMSAQRRSQHAARRERPLCASRLLLYCAQGCEIRARAPGRRHLALLRARPLNIVAVWHAEPRA